MSLLSKHWDTSADSLRDSCLGVGRRRQSRCRATNRQKVARVNTALLFDAHTNSWGVLEIKCPKSLQSVAPCEFADHLSAKQVKAFCLQKTPNGQFLKTNHAYYYQMQLQMGVCEVQWGYFVVWTPLGIHCEQIVFDATFCSAIVAKLTHFHVHYLLPDFFLMKLPRRLSFVSV